MSEEKNNELETATKEVKGTETKTEKKKGGHLMRKIGCWFIFIILLVGSVAGYIRYYYPFAEGVKTGNLNYITKKGYVFKTWEGRLIQEGLKSGKLTGSIQNNEFIFSVADERIAKMMEVISENNLQLHYTEYMHSLPWRGYSEFVVDSIISINNIPVNIYMERLQNGTLNTMKNDAETETRIAQPAPTDINDAMQQLKAAQEQIKVLQQQIESMQQQNTTNGTRRYQKPEDSNRRTDDAVVFPQND